jgi:hypothetical protein
MTYYLVCNKCGHPNEVKTEFLTFCGKCNKKLDNSFTEWKKKNVDKTFEEYKRLACTTSIVQNTTQPKPTTAEKSIMSKVLLYVLGVIALLAVGYAGYFAVENFLGDKIRTYISNPVNDKVLKVTADQVNKSCPVMIDNEIRLDSAEVLPNKVFKYNYTLVNREKAGLNIDDIKQRMSPAIVDQVKASPQTKLFRDYNVTINYTYKDKDGVFLFTILVTPAMYQ